MQNSTVLPLTRNRFFKGKALKSEDFIAEQTYINNKERLSNILYYGAGVVSGLHVSKVDEENIMIHSGAAIDSTGRLLVMENSAIKKLSALEGYSMCKSGELALCIRYAEEQTGAVYMQMGGGEDYENSRIEETCEFYLKDAASLQMPPGATDKYLYYINLYSDDSISIEIEFPKIVVKNSHVKLGLYIHNFADRINTLSLKTHFQLPAFLTGDNSHDFVLDTGIITVPVEGYYKEYWIFAGNSSETISEILKTEKMDELVLNGKIEKIRAPFSLEVELSDHSPHEIIRERLARTSLEEIFMSRFDIPVCKVMLKRGLEDSADLESYGADVPEEIDETGFGKVYIDKISKIYGAFVSLPAFYGDYLSYAENFRDEISLPALQKSGESNYPDKKENFTQKRFESGMFDLPLNNNMKTGDVAYSGEIAHMLGRGEVFVYIGLESYHSKTTGVATGDKIELGSGKFFTDEGGKIAETIEKVTMFGNGSLFAEENSENESIETAVKVYNDRGTFKVAVKLLGRQTFPILTFRWFAYRPEDQIDKSLAFFDRAAIRPHNASVRLKKRETFFFGVEFENMQPLKLVYELENDDSGSITSDGIYTAPGRNGVYEIRIYCAERPTIYTYAYAIVAD